jgi:glycosyltransferase involved in cell wall biosynthesis
MPTNSPQVTQVANSRKSGRQKIKVVALIEATTVNAVAKNVLEFHRAARDLEKHFPDFPAVETSLVTFNRSIHSSSKSENEFVTAATELGLEIDVIPERARFDLRVIPALREIVKRSSPDIVATHQVKSHFLMKLARLNKQYPWVAFHHGYTATDRKMRAYNHLNRWSLPTADRVVTVCEAFARDLESAGVRRERIHVQHNAIRRGREVGEEEITQLRQRLGAASDERIVLSVGRLSREKAQIDLIAAFKHLDAIRSSTKTRLIFVGDGPERQRLETNAASLGVSQRVVFTGEVNDVQPFYAAADLMVLPSHSEGSPYVLLEAMAANLAIVATAVGGVPEMVEDQKSALLVPAGDPQAMALAIDRILSDPELASRLTANASALVSTVYSPATYLHSLVRVYRDLIVTSSLRNP